MKQSLVQGGAFKYKEEKTLIQVLLDGYVFKGKFF
jgi:hypothetical protein